MSGRQICVIMRHGIRADTAGESWQDEGTRPWDPPLAAHGWEDAWQRLEILKSISLKEPDVVYSSPYTRCIQTASIVLKKFGLPYSKLAIDKGLSESYDYFNSVRYVDSDDIIVKATNKYKNMSEWFYHSRHKIITSAGKSQWILKHTETVISLLKKYVHSFWEDSTRAKIPQYGTFPDFECYVPVMGTVTRNRYIRAFERCVGTNENRARNTVIVTHKAGVEVIFEHLFGRLMEDCPTAGFFVIYRDSQQHPFRLALQRFKK